MVGLFSSCADPCKGVACQNGGVCLDGTCDCADGYEGTNCETEIRAKFIASYTVTETCSSSPGQTFTTPITISASNAGALKVVLTNLYFLGWSVVADVDGNNISFTNTDVAGVPAGAVVKATGTGTLAGTVLTINYTITESGISDNCQTSAVKQ
ncbi:MAG: hypothetical protein OHK0039_02120 [Bacteroidia bacterium]